MMKTRSLTLLTLVLAVAMGGCRRAPTPTPMPVVTAPPTPSGSGFTGDGIVASGKVVPERTADLSFTTPGRIATLHARRGDEVQMGDVLATLEMDLLQGEVKIAEAALKTAEADLALARAGPRAEEVAVTEARLRVSEAALSRAQAERSHPELGATGAEVAAAQSQVASATADRLAADEFHEKTMECVDVKWKGEVQTICPLLGPTEEKARYRWHAAEKALDAAQAELDALLAGGSTELQAAQARAWSAAAQRDAAQAELEALQAGPRVERVRVAEAAVAQARADVEAALVALGQAALRAPFGGVVVAVGVEPSEGVQPAQAVLTLADLDGLRVETTDLTERSVADVAVGQEVTVYIEALDIEIVGRVDAIALQANTIGGDVVFTVTIVLDGQPPALRWGMTAEVQIASD